MNDDAELTPTFGKNKLPIFIWVLCCVIFLMLSFYLYFAFRDRSHSGLFDNSDKIIVGLLALIASVISVSSTFKIERLKFSLSAKFEKEKMLLNQSIQKELTLFGINVDRLKKIYDIHLKKEYELYEFIYPQILNAYEAFCQTKSVDEDPLISELLKLDPSDECENGEIIHPSIRRSRENSLEFALSHLSFMNEIVKRKPFIHPDVYSEIQKFWQMGYDTYIVRNYPNLFKAPFNADKRAYSNAEIEIQLDAVTAAIMNLLATNSSYKLS